jgi:hypothetical protein
LAGRAAAQCLLLTLVLALAWGVLSAGAAFAGPDEGSFASAVNAARSGHGVAPMSLQAEL